MTGALAQVGTSELAGRSEEMACAAQERDGEPGQCLQGAGASE